MRGDGPTAEPLPERTPTCRISSARPRFFDDQRDRNVATGDPCVALLFVIALSFFTLSLVDQIHEAA